MSTSITQKLITILGPTASGKSEFAVRIAQQINGEIISADSRQVYRGLNIGTGKITKKEMCGIKHYCLDAVDPKKLYTVDDYKKDALEAIKKIQKKGKTPILVGGTGFYIDSILYKTNLPAVKPNIKLRAQLEKKSLTELFTLLKKLDPRRARSIDRYNSRRLIRAIEIIKATGKPIPINEKTSRFDTHIIGIHLPKDELQARISKRVDSMIRRGLIKETQKLIKTKVPRRRIEEFGFEYRYPLLYLDGKISKKEMTERIKIETWHYAKRQMTWFKRNQNIYWATSTPGAEKYIKKTYYNVPCLKH
ncbi:MAG: tRNA (adenosine(37)-N6)-dimethylallyltransferase MiaA [Patescibacteria group bacterium]